MQPTTGITSNEDEDPKGDEESSSSSDEDEDACELTEEFEKKFFRTLSCLKKKDPQIYDKDARFFEKLPEIDENVIKEKRRKKPESSLTLREYEKQQLLENGGLLSDEDKHLELPKNRKKTYVEEQRELKESFKKVLCSDSDADSDDEIGGLFREHSKSKAEKEKEEEDYREWLKGQRTEIDDKAAEGDMKYLHDYWNDPNLDQDEKFLRDYILNKRFLDKDDNGEDDPDKFVSLEEDEKILNNQIQFEHKYNFRFEEPDQEFIKRYPRIMENSMRKKDNKRKLKREAAKKRKLEEKEKKIKELRKLQSVKRKEIEEKIKKIKEATGNEVLGFKDEDIEKDFDPNEHDLQMQKLFSEEFYNQEECEKPSFNEDLDLDQYKDENDEISYYEDRKGNFDGDDFIMDCDYTPEKAALEKKKKLEARQKKKEKKKMVSARESIDLNKNVAKPVFDKSLHKTFQNYLDEYYSLDCEDFIGDMPCRFKYRQVVPNNFGLTIEEILAADDKELNKWCSLQKMYQIRPVEVEMYDVKAYERKAKNEELKRKILPSLYKSNEDDAGNESGSEKKKKKKKKKKKLSFSEQDLPTQPDENKVKSEIETECKKNSENHSKRKHEHIEEGAVEDETSSMLGNKQPVIKKFKSTDSENFNKRSNAGSSDVLSNLKRKKHKKDHAGKTPGEDTKLNKQDNLISNEDMEAPNRVNYEKKKKQKSFNFNNVYQKSNYPLSKSKQTCNKGNKLNKNAVNSKSDLVTFYNDISDTRLKAYGIKPKKFKNKLKYGNTN